MPVACHVLVAAADRHLGPGAVRERQLSALRLLGERGALGGRGGALPLVQASTMDSDGSLTRLLLAAGADVSYATEDGHTALHSVYNASVVKALIAAGADVNAGRGRDCGTPLHACGVCCRVPGIVGIARLLLDAGADVNAVASNGGTPLESAARREGPPFRLMRLLLSAGADPTIGRSVALSPLVLMQPTAASTVADVKRWRLLVRAAAWQRRRHVLLAVRRREALAPTATAAPAPASPAAAAAAPGASATSTDDGRGAHAAAALLGLSASGAFA